MLKVTQKLHTHNKHTQAVDYVNYFSRVTIDTATTTACFGLHTHTQTLQA